MSIRTRIFLTFLVLVLVGFSALLHWVIDDLRPRYMETMEESMVDTATLLSSFLATNLEGGTESLRVAFDEAQRRRFAAKIYQVTKTRLELRVYVTDQRGVVRFDSDGGREEGADYSRWNDVRRTLGGTYGARASRADPEDPRSTALYVASPIERDGRIVGVVSVSKPTASVREFLDLAKRKTILAGAAAALGVVLLGMLVSARIAGPIRKLTDHARAVRDGRRVPLPKLGGGEIGTLGRAFEEMRDALEGKEYVEGYVAALTHEMKSPLSAIQGAAELLEDDAMPKADRLRFLENIRGEAARMRDVVDRLLELSSLEKRRGLEDVETFDLSETAREVVSAMEAVLSGKRLSVILDGDASVPIRGEKFLIRQSLSNLLQNASDFSPPGGTIEVRVARQDGHAEISVRDQGPGVPDFARSRIFERFYSLERPDGGRKGSGLGLTFVREAVGLHDGEARLENAPGGGARAVVRLPLRPADSPLPG